MQKIILTVEANFIYAWKYCLFGPNWQFPKFARTQEPTGWMYHWEWPVTGESHVLFHKILKYVSQTNPWKIFSFILEGKNLSRKFLHLFYLGYKNSNFFPPLKHNSEHILIVNPTNITEKNVTIPWGRGKGLFLLHLSCAVRAWKGKFLLMVII